MKKLISMVMAAAMVVSLVPATAFAANTATFKVVNDKEYTDANADKNVKIEGPELQIKLKDVDSATNKQDKFEITLDFDNAEVKGALGTTNLANAKVIRDNTTMTANVPTVAPKNEVKAGDKETSITLVVTEAGDTVADNLKDGDVIAIPLKDLNLYLTKTGKGTKATVEVGGDFGDSDALTFASVLGTGIKATLKKVAEVAEEETTELEKDLKIESTVDSFADGQRIELKLNSGFEWALSDDQIDALEAMSEISDAVVNDDKDVLTLTVTGNDVDEFTINKDNLTIDAATAKVGAVAKITVKALADDEDGDKVEGAFKATADAVEAVKVVDSAVTLSVDEDEDVPVIYSGVNVDNDGITDDSDHLSLEVTLKESAKGALDVKKAFTLALPEGVYATNVEVTNTDGVEVAGNNVELAFAQAYKKGEQEKFEFARKTFTATDDADVNKEMDLEFKLELIAEPDFEGDVTLTLGGDAFDKEQEVTIAKFVKPYTIEASQNDLIIDYRNTKVPTNIVVKEAEAGLWSDKTNEELKFTFDIDRFDDDAFENDATYTVDDKSDLEVKANSKGLGFKVTEASDDEAAAVTISNIALYMGRSIAAGAYDLELITNAGEKMMTEERLFTTDKGETGTASVLTDIDGANVSGATATVPYYAADYRDWKTTTDRDNYVSFVSDSFVVKEGFINVITAGRDQDDASFTKKVVVPVGENYLIAGEEQVALDVPAYISADGYTMLPVRAVATALGINNNNVLWNQATKTVTILYGQRIITMVAGQKVVTVNGNTIPASATVQIVNGRTFLPMRDLATALGVTDITWDAATKTATMNGTQNK